MSSNIRREGISLPRLSPSPPSLSFSQGLAVIVRIILLQTVDEFNACTVLDNELSASLTPSLVVCPFGIAQVDVE